MTPISFMGATYSAARKVYRLMIRLGCGAVSPLTAATALAAGSLLTLSVSTAASNRTLVYCSEGSPAGFDPGQYTTGVEFSTAYAIYNRLVEFARGETKIEPGLAESWEVSSDGRQYTFRLRRGVKFQTTAYFKPSRDFNADDVIFTFNRMQDPQMPFRKAYPSSFPYYSDMGFDKNIVKIEKDEKDPYIVRFTLKNVSAPFIQNLAVPFASILSKEYADQLLKAGHPERINREPIGTGPYQFRSYQPDAVIRFERNPHYWKPQDAPLAGLVYSIVTDPAVRAQKLINNECQVSVYPRPADLPQLKRAPNIRVLSQVGFNLAFLAYNTAHKQFNRDHVDVRRALDMAIDKRAIIKSVYQGAGQLATNLMPPTEWSYIRLKDAPYNPQRAKALLAKAGYPNGFATTLWAMPVQRPYNPNARLMAEMIQADWSKIGVKAKIVTYEWGEYIKRAEAGEHDTILVGWNGDNGDPDNWLGVLLSCSAVKGNNFAKWCYPPFEKLIQQARQTTDQNKRIKLYQQAQRIFKDQLPFTPIAHSKEYQPISKQVVGFRINPLGVVRFDGVSLK